MSKIKELKENNRDSVVCVVKEVSKGVSTSQSAYLNLVLQDNTGKIDAKKWEANEKDIESFKVGNVLSLLVDPINYRGSMQLKIVDYDLLKDFKDIKELIIKPPVPTDTLELEFKSFINKINNLDIKNIVVEIVKNVYDEFIFHPAAKTNHHEYTSGLLHHEVSMLKLAEAISNLYPTINKDLLYGGIILHDIGKIRELSGPITTEYTIEGRLLGHISIINAEIAKVAEKLNIKSQAVILLQHMFLSHHGKLEYGSPVMPHTLEAEVMYLIDNMDSKITMINKALADLEDNTFSNKIMPLEGQAFYKYKL